MNTQNVKKLISIVAFLTIIFSLLFFFLFFSGFEGERIPYIMNGLLLPVIMTLTIISALILRYLRPSSDKNYAESIDDLVNSQSKTKDINVYFSISLLRLNREVQNLTKRGNLNLALGTVTALSGIWILAKTAFSIHQTQDIQNFAFFFTPRLSLAIMIEIFSYFFLKLYRQNLYEIKYFQNEITNIELKLFSTYLSIQTADCQQINTIACKLADTDRNAIINKGQATVEIEKDSINQNNESKWIQLLSTLTNK